MPLPPGTWVRCEVDLDTKARLRRTAQLLGWNVPGVEAWCLGYLTHALTPEELAELIVSFYNPPAEGEKGETPV
jgi:hypothetical protein